MKQQKLKKSIGTIRICTCLLVCIISTVLTAGVLADYPPFHPDEFPYPSSITQFGSSTSYTTSPSSSSDSTTQASIVITESMIPLMKDQSAIYMINFQNAGTLVASSLSGSGFDLYSKQGTIYPQNVTSRSEYGSVSKVTSSSPVSLDVAAGTWYFTIFPIGDSCKYDIKAIQKGTTTSSTSSTQTTYSSSVGSKSLGFR